MLTPHQSNDPPDIALAPDEGGLRAPPGLSFWGKAWWWFHFLILVKLARLRFIAVLVAIGLVIVKWDTLIAYYERWTRPATAAQQAAADVEYFCPMHPTVIRDTPKQKCPICNMPLSRRKKGDATEVALPAGIVNRVQLTPYRIVLAGIQTSRVEYQPLTKEINTVGFVEFNERELKQVTARVKGRIEKLFVSETGQYVQAGEPLALLYSPELIVTAQSLFDADPRTVESARQRLKLWGVGDKQVQKIIESRKPTTELEVLSPIKGHVLKRYVKEGQYVDEGAPLYDVVDLSTVWIQAQVYEDDMAFLPVHHRPLKGEAAARLGLSVSAYARAYPGVTFEGKLTFVFPHVDQETRSVLVRFEMDNFDHKLRPGTTMSVKLKIPVKQLDLLQDRLEERLKWETTIESLAVAFGDPSGMQGWRPLVRTAIDRMLLDKGYWLAIPESAVIDTGSMRIVYREAAPGEYEGVKVELGPRMIGPDDTPYYPVLSGLNANDTIVTLGSFLLDAETRLNPAAGSIYFGGSSGSKSAGGSTVKPSTPEDEDLKIKATLAKLSDADRAVADAQVFCPVRPQTPLGSMGVPIKLTVNNQTVLLCCIACEKAALAQSQEMLKKAIALKAKKKS